MSKNSEIIMGALGVVLLAALVWGATLAYQNNEMANKNTQSADATTSISSTSTSNEDLSKDLSKVDFQMKALNEESAAAGSNAQY